jgi:hypothetical protein
MKKLLIAIALFLVIPMTNAEAKKYYTSIHVEKLTHYQKCDIISRSYYSMSYLQLRRTSKLKAAGVRNAAFLAIVKLDPRCVSNVLIWDSLHIYSGMKYYNNQMRKKVTRVTTRKVVRKRITIIRRKVVRKRVTITNRQVVQRNTTQNVFDNRIYNDNRRSNTYNIQVTKKYDCGEDCKKKSKPYVEPSRILVSGYFLRESMKGKQFSHGGGGDTEFKLLGKLHSIFGRMELKLGGMTTKYIADGRFVALNSSISLLLGKSSGNFQILGGISADFLHGSDTYGGFDVKFVEGALKAMFLVRYDSKWFSLEARAATGGGAQKVMDTSPLFRADTLVQMEVHVGKHLDILVNGSLRFDLLDVQHVMRDNWTVSSTGTLRAIWGHFNMEAGVEVGRHFGSLSTASFITSRLGLGYSF